MKVVVPFDTARTVGTPVGEPKEQEDGHLAGLFGLKTLPKAVCISELLQASTRLHSCVTEESHITNINRDFLLYFEVCHPSCACKLMALSGSQ
jgi:hypothetical protein